MIVKNEAGNLRRCLESVNGAVDEIIVVDTGSTDNTSLIAQEYGALVQTFTWKDNFSDARNASLEKASGDWILFLDADEELAPQSKEALRKLTRDNNVEGYFIKVMNYLGNEGWTDTCPDLIFRLFRNRKNYRFRGAIHEQIVDVILEQNNQAGFRMAEEIIINHYGYLDKQIDEKDKKNRNIKIIKSELEQNPANQLLRFHYGVELFRAERFAEAVIELTQVANNVNPNTIYFPKLIRYIIMSYQSTGQPGSALEAVRQGLQLFPNYADLYYYAGLNYLELKQYAYAAEAFQKAVELPEQPAQYASFNGVRGYRSYYHLGQIAEIFLNYEEALKYYISSLQDNPDFLTALESIVSILKPRENPEYTKECLEKVFEFSTTRANQFMGEIFFRQGAYRLALEYLSKAAENRIASPETKFPLAVCLIQERRYLEALRIIDGIPPGSSLYPMAKLNKFLCFWIQCHKKKVRSLFNELRSFGLAEDTDSVLNMLISLMDKRKKISGIELGPDGLTLAMDIVTRLLYMGEADRAMSLLQSISPKSLEEKKLSFAQLFFEYGCPENAEKLLKEYLAANQDAEAHIIMAEIYRTKGDYFTAEQHYKYALEINPDEPGYYIKLINLYESKRRDILHEALQKYPDITLFNKLLGEA